MAIRAASSQQARPSLLVWISQRQVLVTCLDCGAVTQISRAYVAERCGEAQDVATFPLQQSSQGLAFMVDGSHLTKGVTARLCASMGAEPFMDTALEVFVSPFSDVLPVRLPFGSGQIRLKCDHFVCPSKTTLVRLASSCTQDGAQTLRMQGLKAWKWA